VDVLRRILAWHGFRKAAASFSESDLEPALRLRDVLTSAFDARSAKGAVAILNELAAEAGSPPRLERSRGGWRLRTWPDETVGLAFVAGYAAVGLLETIRESGVTRFGRCAGSPCRCVFVDRSRNRSRRYCCQLCADRVAQSALRRRRSSTRSGSAGRSTRRAPQTGS
jgi:predicted RNA-binding Zn ribbon-like protein